MSRRTTVCGVWCLRPLFFHRHRSKMCSLDDVRLLCDAVLDRDQAACKRVVLKCGKVVITARDYRYPEGMSALHLAACDRAEILEFLLEQKVDSNLLDGGGRTPLMYAAHQGTAACARALLQHGAKADLRDEEGSSALDLARKYSKKETIALLEAVPMTRRVPSKPTTAKKPMKTFLISAPSKFQHIGHMGIDGSGEPVSLAHESEYDWDSLFREADIDPSQMDAARYVLVMHSHAISYICSQFFFLACDSRRSLSFNNIAHRR
eukprot:m.215798 g.215798  ORF g.215798 m.215798 type:complete len:264 (+) comp54085_c0_seq11:167-958(+)